MKKILFAVFFLLATVTTFAQKTDTRQITPEEIKLRDELEADQSFLQMFCNNLGKSSRLLDAQKENLRVRWLIYEASQTDKSVKAKRTCSTIEGTPVISYIIVEKGKAKLVIDASRDEYGSMRVHSYNCDKLLIGSYEFNKDKNEMTFKPLSREEVGTNVPSFQCQAADKSLIF